MENLDYLNEKQKQAVLHINGPLLIIAGPGSGKTRTLVERVLYLLNNVGAEPKNILLATFTEKASRELITRVSEKIEKNINLSEMYVGTIHSICLRIIDENIEKSFLKRNYKVLDDTDQKFFIYKNMKKFENIEGFNEFFQGMNADTHWKRVGILRRWIDKINEEKLDNKNIEKSFDGRIIFLRKVHERYREILFEENTIDFSNIQLECLRMISENREILKKLQEEIKYIMIDEYQDTNAVQEKLFLLIGGERKNICVVGDDDQGIYRFRGATVKNILHFQKNFPEGECRKIELDINYRSNEDIVNFCNRWNSQLNWDGWRYDKKIVSGKERINKTLGVAKISDVSQYKWEERIYKFINFLKTTGKIEDYNQAAFLFRSVKTYKIHALMEYLTNRGISVYSPRSNMFFGREEIKFIIGIFLMVFPLALEITAKNREEVRDYYESCLKTARDNIKDDEVLKDYIKSVREKFKSSEIKIKSPNFLGIFYEIIETGTKTIKKYLDLEENSIVKNRSTYNLGIFSKILNKIDIFCSLEEIGEKNTEKILDYFFNKHMKFLIEDGVGEYESMREYAPKGAVSFLTIHQGKGLEFPFVIVGPLEEQPTVEKNEVQLKLDSILTKTFEPDYRKNEFDFWRMYYTAFSRAQNLLALTCVEDNYKPVPSMPFKRVFEELKDVRSGDFEYKKLAFEKIKDINIKEIFAFNSHIKLYDLCPRIYKMQKKYEFVMPKTKGMIFGTLVHETLEDINRKFFKKEEVSEETVKKIFIENYENIYKKYKISLEKETLNTGEESIIEYIKDCSEITENIKDVEIKLSFVKDNYILEGIIDLVSEIKGGIEIIDFKTGKRENSEKEYINQLEIYAYLLKEKYGKKIKKGKLYYFGEERKNRITEIVFNEERLSEAVKNFDRTAEKILAGDFECHFEETNRKCSSCYLKNYCTEEREYV